MRRVLTGYAMYFNKKYKRVGHLYEGRYKAVAVLSDEYLLYVTRYIHRNPLKLKAEKQQFTSISYFLGDKKANWIKPDEILHYFNDSNPNLSYKSFVEDDKNEVELENLTLE